MKINQTKYYVELIPEEGMRLANKDKTEVYEYSICLGTNDSPDNYVELTEEDAEIIENNKETE